MKKNSLYVFMLALLTLCCMISCAKQKLVSEEAKIEPPLRAYVVTARIDRKGTNSTSRGVGVLKGAYDEGTKLLNYTLTYDTITPALITLRSGVKGSVGELIREMYKGDGLDIPKQTINGNLTLSPLQERNLLKGLWFVAISSGLTTAPEISGSLTLKQK